MTVLRTAIEPSRPGDHPHSVDELVRIIAEARDEMVRLDPRRTRAIVVALAALARVAEQEAQIERELEGMSLQ